MKKFLIVLEQTKTGYSAYSPDLPGCIATGGTKRKVEENMRAAIAFHVVGLREDGEPVPKPRTYSAHIDMP
jgi:predicted RNase H-like HicB family nuclease